MPILAIALALTATALPSGVSVATLGEKASPFQTLAECEAAIAPTAMANDAPGAPAGPRGSLFNRAAGNMSRCEIVDGEPLIIVMPREVRR